MKFLQGARPLLPLLPLPPLSRPPSTEALSGRTFGLINILCFYHYRLISFLIPNKWWPISKLNMTQHMLSTFNPWRLNSNKVFGSVRLQANFEKHLEQPSHFTQEVTKSIKLTWWMTQSSQTASIESLLFNPNVYYTIPVKYICSKYISAQTFPVDIRNGNSTIVYIFFCKAEGWNRGKNSGRLKHITLIMDNRR